MNAKVDMDECEKRNRWGFHRIAAGRDNTLIGAGGMLLVDSSRLLPLIMLSCFLSGAAVIGVLLVSMMLPPRTQAEARAEIARAEALADLARKEAGIAKDMVDLDRQKAKAREELKNER